MGLFSWFKANDFASMDERGSGGALDDDWAERSGYTVYGKDILDGPDWVKAIKPIEVKE